MTAPAAPAAGRSGSPLGYAVSAVGFKSYFNFMTRPGRTVRGTLSVVNLTPGARTILLAPVDVSTAAAGGLQYGNDAPRGEGRWLKLVVRRVRLSGAGSASVPFTVRVPSGARSGEHFLGITAVDRRVLTQRAGRRGRIRLRLIPRLAMTVQLRLPGPLTRALALGSFNVSVAPSGASLGLQISNAGNALIGTTRGAATVSQGSTVLFRQPIELAAFVPQTTITYHVPWRERRSRAPIA